jgi:hypothetical protein
VFSVGVNGVHVLQAPLKNATPSVLEYVAAPAPVINAKLI